MAKTITIYLTDEDERIMLDMVLDIDDWFNAGPFKEKIANHKSRIANQMRQKLEARGAKMIPNSEELIKMYFAEPDYINRHQREEELNK